ncbi:helicase associated domain-containing protein [Actinophytocola glycyrrhizae]|uniref:Helicase associated domain protein n=1 Tax=Actinophytocola glycyrrhizae TaxID=2044873 RepID=A0ABV9SEC6_9PSEU
MATGLIHVDRGQLRLPRCISEITVAIDVVGRLLRSGLIVVLTGNQDLVDHVVAGWNRTHPDAAYLVTGRRSGNLPRSVLYASSPDVIAAWAAADTAGLRVLVSQHRHADLVGEGLLKAGGWADLVIVHDAQHTAGPAKRRAAVHDDRMLPAAARLYTTASPRVFRRAEVPSTDPDGVALSMDEEAVFGSVLHEYSAEQALTDGVAAAFRLRITRSAGEPVSGRVFCVHRSRRTIKVSLAAAMTAAAATGEALMPGGSALAGDELSCRSDCTDGVTVTVALPVVSDPDSAITITIASGWVSAVIEDDWVDALRTHAGVGHVLRALREWDPAFGHALDAARSHGADHHKVLLHWIDIEPPTPGSGVEDVLAALAAAGADDWWVGYGHLAAHHARTGTAIVPIKHEVDGYPLGSWLVTTRTTYAHEGLPLARYNAFRALGATTGTQHDLERQRRWERHIATATAFHARYGHLDVDLPSTEAPKEFRAWVSNVRRGHWPVTDAERARLDALGMLWDSPLLLRRKAVAAAFADYGARHGNLHIPDGCVVQVRGEHTRLAPWVNVFRDEHRLDTLDPDVRRVLQEAGFVFDPDEAWWQDLITTARRHHELHGDLDVAPGTVHTAAGECLCTILRTCRVRLWGRSFAPDRAASLTALDPLWGTIRTQSTRPEPRLTHPTGKPVSAQPVPRPQQVSTGNATVRTGLPAGRDTGPRFTDWDVVFAVVKQFHGQHGHLDVPDDLRAVPPGGGPGTLVRPWLNNQRPRLEAGRTTNEQKNRLDSVGFIWNAEEAEWMAKYRLASRFHQEHGHLAVTKPHTRKNHEWTPLLTWLRAQVRLRAARRLTDTRVELLNRLGMPWVERPGREHHWDHLLQQVDTYRRTHGHTHMYAHLARITDDVERAELKKVAAWLNDQLVYARRGTLRKDRRAKLTAIGIDVPEPYLAHAQVDEQK